jgi:biopolymer transport protein ExbD
MIRLTPHQDKEPFVQISPMIDLVFLLLVFFIVSTMYMNQAYTVPVDVPEGAASVVQQKAVDVAILQDGTLYYESRPVSPAELEQLAKGRMEEEPNASFIIRGDKNVSYGRVVGTLEILKKAGVRDFSLAVEAGGQS